MPVCPTFSLRAGWAARVDAIAPAAAERNVRLCISEAYQQPQRDLPRIEGVQSDGAESVARSHPDLEPARGIVREIGRAQAAGVSAAVLGVVQQIGGIRVHVQGHRL